MLHFLVREISIMVKFRCEICNREFSSSHGLTQHRNAKHCGRITHSQTSEIANQRNRRQRSDVTRPEHDANLWGAPITLSASGPDPTSTILAEVPVPQEEEMDIDFGEPPENDEKNNEANDELQPLMNLENVDFDPEDLQGASLEDALDTIEGKYRPERIANYPNDAYREFMELITDGNISNKSGDKIIKFFNKYSNCDKSLLPSSTKAGKDYLNQVNSPSLNFKEKIIATYNGVNFILYYRPIFRAIQVLIQ